MPVNFVEFQTDEDVDAAALNSRFESLDDAIENLASGSKTLSAPTVSSFANALHDHEDAAGGGQITLDAIDSGAAVDGSVPLADGAGGAAWGVPGYAPVGAMLPMTHSTVPAGWLLCDGQAVSRAAYADLFAYYDTDGLVWGVGDGATTFNVPDMRGRFPLGLDNMGGSSANRVTAAAADSIGGTGGAEEKTQTSSQMPSHTHAPTGGGQMTRDTGADRVKPSGGTVSYPNLVLDNTGGGNPMDVMNPWAAMPWIVKT